MATTLIISLLANSLSGSLASNSSAASGKIRNPVYRQHRNKLATRSVKPLFFALSLLPFLLLLWSVLTANAGPNPVETIEKSTGEWSLRFLLLSLAMTPAAELFKSLWPVKLRRMAGLFAFFYVMVHFLTWLVLDQYLNFADIVTDVIEKPFITVGFVGFLILLPLAATSNRFAVRKLKSSWKTLHRWVYVAGVAGVLHYVWLAKGERNEPLVYLAILLLLLVWRVRKLISGARKTG